MKRKIIISVVIVIILIGLLFLNILLLGFSHRLLAFYIQWVIIFFLTLFSIDVIFFKLQKLLSVLMFIIITVSVALYFNNKEELRVDAEMFFFNNKKNELNQIVDFINKKYKGKRSINIDSLNIVINRMGFKEMQLRKDYVAFRVSKGFYPLNGFIYMQNPKPRYLFGEYVTPRRKIDKNWYSIN